MTLLPPLLFTCCMAAALSAQAQQLPVPEPLGEPATTVYRQVTPDGQVIYSDRAQRGARVDQKLEVEPAADGLWSAQPGPRPAAPGRSQSTSVKQVTSIPEPGRRKTLEEATSELIRSEMVLEDARKKRDAGHVPLAAETGNTGPGTPYAARQRVLQREVTEAEAQVKRARAEVEALRRSPRR